jgi:hypothetical protein
VSQDGFGTRTLHIDQDTGDPVEVLTFAPVLARAPEFATAIGDRVLRLARVRHAMYARARSLDRRDDESLLLVSDHVPGWRLDRVLDIIERERWTLDVTAVVTLLRQLIPAVALFSRHQRDATIGTIGPERLILTPQGRLVVAEYVLAPGLEKLQFSRERLWREFRVAVPAAAASRVSPSADVVGIGVVAISLLIGRRLRQDEYLVGLGDLFDTLTESSNGTSTKLSAAFRTWVARALQFESQTSYQTTQEAQLAFEEMLARERSYVSTSAQLDRFIASLTNVIGAPDAAAAPVAVTAPVVPVVGAMRHVADGQDAPVAAVGSGEPGVPVTPLVAAVSPLDAAPEPEATFAVPGPSVSDSSWRRFAVPALLVLSLAQAGVIAWLVGADASAARSGALSIQSRPVAARVTIDGEERGSTPFETEISKGPHVIEVRVGRSEPRVIPVVIREGVQTGLYVELQSVATVGGLEVRSDPGKARVTVGGQFRGETPLMLKDLPPGDVEVLVQAGSREVRQMVRIEPGITSQLVVPLAR